MYGRYKPIYVCLIYYICVSSMDNSILLEAMHIFDCVDIQEALKLCIFLIGNMPCSFIFNVNLFFDCYAKSAPGQNFSGHTQK
jgi:hypothetical protein